MQNLWDDTVASRCTAPLALRAYSSRLIGGDKTMVLYGGGNTSLKTADTLYVKGTGVDLGAVREEHFTALDLLRLRALLDDAQIPDAELMRRVDDCKHSPKAAKPSIETLLHAALPYACVEHAHADAVLAVANVSNCEERCAEVFGDLAPVVPYRHSGAALARACQDVLNTQATPRTIGLVLAFHGVVAFGHSARESYGNLLRLVTLAEDWLRSRTAWNLPVAPIADADTSLAQGLRDQASALAGFPLSMRIVSTPETLAFARRADRADASWRCQPGGRDRLVADRRRDGRRDRN